MGSDSSEHEEREGTNQDAVQEREMTEGRKHVLAKLNEMGLDTHKKSPNRRVTLLTPLSLRQVSQIHPPPTPICLSEP